MTCPGNSLARGDLAGAQATLIGIQQKVPNYEDVDSLLADIARQQQLAGVMSQAAIAVASKDWENVVSQLEKARPLVTPQNLPSLQADLFDAYLNLAGQIVAKSQGRPSEMQRAVGIYGKALALRPEDESTTAQRDDAQEFIAGSNDFRNGNWDTAIINLEELYAAQPNYLGGVLVNLLYNSYMQKAEQLLATGNAADLDNAWDVCRRASSLKGVDTRAAAAMESQLAGLISLSAQPPQPAGAAPPGPAGSRAHLSWPPIRLSANIKARSLSCAGCRMPLKSGSWTPTARMPLPRPTRGRQSQIFRPWPTSRFARPTGNKRSALPRLQMRSINRSS